MSFHFEDLWELCEKLHPTSYHTTSVQSTIDELLIKINLYKAVDQKLELSEDERGKIKSRLYGEILFSLTNLSVIDNINVFECLVNSYNYRIDK